MTLDKWLTCRIHRYATAQSTPPVDASQDLVDYNVLQTASNEVTHTIVTFTRPVSSDDMNDIALNQDRFILYAWGVENNFNGADPSSIAFHGASVANRGFSPGKIPILCEGMILITKLRANCSFVAD